jgi:nitroimidazol reductase NimA-like FMN-containing flavoprotein (pyridoxamine 5'-phosphate oxidase superfamily)
MLGELGADEIEDLLRSEIVGRIGCLADGWPYVVPVSYVYDGESVYVHSAEGRKVRAMRENPQVCFEVERIKSTTDWHTVIAKGRFESMWRDVNDYAMNLLAARYATASSSASAHLERNERARRLQGVERPVLYRIRLVEKTGRFEGT